MGVDSEVGVVDVRDEWRSRGAIDDVNGANMDDDAHGETYGCDVSDGDVGETCGGCGVEGVYEGDVMTSEQLVNLGKSG